MQWLIEQGLDVHAKDNNGWTVLHDAALSGNMKLMQWLIEQGLDVHAKSASGITPQHLFPLIKK
ncbi:MAG: ankyrin repeat domain-containing protein, partial [Thermoguttaceae bacterium]|nr:ankyrin repeat domain-containing protein [Thermoguttaceae bacterium]